MFCETYGSAQLKHPTHLWKIQYILEIPGEDQYNMKILRKINKIVKILGKSIKW